MSKNNRRKSRNNRGRSRRNKKSNHDKWLAFLQKEYGAYHQANSKDLRQLIMIYEGRVPPRMPTPGGPSKGAHLTTTQFVRGQDMTLPTGSAIVGSLIRQNTATDVFAAWAFCLADVPNITALSSLFDQYRIDEIQFRLRTRNPAVTVQNAASPNYATTSPLIVVDRDDAAAPTTLSELQQYDNCNCFSTQDSIDIVFEPSITPSVFSGGAFSGYAVDESGKYWLDVANTSIPHYGIKIAMPALVTSTTQKFDWDVEAVYKVSFLNIR